MTVGSKPIPILFFILNAWKAKRIFPFTSNVFITFSLCHLFFISGFYLFISLPYLLLYHFCLFFFFNFLSLLSLLLDTSILVVYERAVCVLIYHFLC